CEPQVDAARAVKSADVRDLQLRDVQGTLRAWADRRTWATPRSLPGGPGAGPPRQGAGAWWSSPEKAVPRGACEQRPHRGWRGTLYCSPQQPPGRREPEDRDHAPRAMAGVRCGPGDR